MLQWLPRNFVNYLTNNAANLIGTAVAAFFSSLGAYFISNRVFRRNDETVEAERRFQETLEVIKQGNADLSKKLQDGNNGLKRDIEDNVSEIIRQVNVNTNDQSALLQAHITASDVNTEANILASVTAAANQSAANHANTQASVAAAANQSTVNHAHTHNSLAENRSGFFNTHKLPDGLDGDLAFNNG